LLHSNGSVFYFIFPGVYACVNCKNHLFSSVSKYEHSSPWPAFNKLIREDSVQRIQETKTAIKVIILTRMWLIIILYCMNFIFILAVHIIDWLILLSCLAPLSAIFRLYRGSLFYWWRKPEDPKKTNDLSQVTEKTLSQNVVSSTPCMNRIWTHNFNCNRYWLHRLIQLPYDHDHDDPLCRIKLNNIINILIIKRNALFFVLLQEKKNNQTYALLVFI
jgi:hypothetical protein